MTSGFLQRGFYIAAFLVAVLAVSLGVSRYSYGQALDQLSRQGHADLTLASDRLTAQLQRFRELAVYLADHPVMGPLSRGAQPVETRRLFLDVADKTAALDVMFVDLGGQVRVAARSEPGADLSGESFVRRAMHGALGWGQGVRAPLPARAFYYAAPSFDRNGKVQGAVVVAADISDIENNWRSGNPAVFFTDDNGEVFVSNRTELVAWRRPDAAPGLVPPNGVPLEFSSYMAGPHEVWQLEWGPYLPKSALHLTQPVPVVGLTGEALLNVAPAARLATSQALAVAGLCLAFGALLFWLCL